LLVLIAVNILNFYDRNLVGALVEPIRMEFRLTDTQVGLLGSVFIWLYAIVGLPLGALADRWSRKKLLVAGMLVWSALTGVGAIAVTYSMLMISRLGFAMGEAAVAPTATSWLGDLFPARKRAGALALFMLGVPVGGALSFFISGPVAQAYGWRAAMLLAASAAVVFVPLVLRLREPERGAADNYRGPVARGGILALLRIRTMWWIIASGALLNFDMYAFATFTPAFLSRVHRLSLAHSGVGAGIIYAVGGVAGGLFAGWLGDNIANKRKSGRLRWAGTISLIGAPMLYFGVTSGNVLFAIGFLVVAYGTWCAYYGLVYSSIHDIVVPALRGTAMAIYFMAMYLCGASFGPLLTGKLSDILARRAAEAAGSTTLTEASRAIGLQHAMLIMPVLSVMLGVVLYCGSRTIAQDIERREAEVATAAGAN
jgi:MFS family permease